MASFIGDNNGWLDGYSRPSKKKKKAKVEIADFKATVIYVPVICPECKSTKVRCYGKARGEGRIARYHECDMGHKFKSIEVFEFEVNLKNNLF